MQGVTPWNKSRTYEAALGPRAEEVKRKQRINHRGGSVTSSQEVELSRRAKISKSAKLNVHGNYGGYKPGSGRGKKGRYRGYWCDSSWELAFVIYHLEHGIEFERNRVGFPYLHEGKSRMWFPDFVMGDTFVEIKGYMTEQDRSKLTCFTQPIKVLTKEDLVEVLGYVESKYGKKFTSLYDMVAVV
jgi:hypothetical protein